MPLPELRMSFADQPALAQELDGNLKHGRAFLLGASQVEVLADCVLVLVHPDGGQEFGLRGQVVMVSDSEPMRGVGIQLRPFDPSVVQALAAFVAGDPDARGTAEIARPERREVAAQPDLARESERGEDTGLLGPEGRAQSEGENDDLELDGHDDLERGDEHEHEELEEYGEEYEPPEPADGQVAAAGEQDDRQDGEPSAGDDDGDDDGSQNGTDLQQQPKRHERLRKLNVTQQHKLARNGELNDRVMLERIFGKTVWEGLLQNPKLTLPEVARIARKGTVPRPLIEQIVENNGWIQSPLVRRALLSNPRVSGEGILKLLRITPRHELKVIYKTTTYSTQVREAARKVLEL